jgi:small subunit ribosomal protein S1
MATANIATNPPARKLRRCSRNHCRARDAAGRAITAEVVRVDFNVVVVNADLRAESFIPIEEFKNDNGEVEVKPATVTVALNRSRTATARPLSRDKAKRLKA